MNDIITQNIKNIVVDHISGEYSQTLTKYSYIGKGALDFIQFTQNPSYQGYTREMEILSNVNFGNSYHQILDLGPGNGMKGLSLIHAMSLQLQRYIALDISTQMLDIASQCQKNIAHIQRFYIQEDFDDFSRFHTHRDRPSLFMMLGNTITNLVDIQSYLRDLFIIFHDEDILLLGVEISDNENIDSLVEEYNAPENKILTFRPLEYIGVPPTAGYVDIFFNPEKKRIEEWFVFQETVALPGISIPQDTRVLLSVTNKPSRGELITSIEQSGFQIRQTYNIQEQYVLCLGKASG